MIESAVQRRAGTRHVACAGLWTSAAILLTCALGVARAQGSPSGAVAARRLRGVTIASGKPLAGVNVFDVATLNGALSSETGSFVIVLDARETGRVRVAARKVGYKPLDTTLTSLTTLPDSIVLTLEQVRVLAPQHIQAGRFTAGVERTAALSPIEVMTTPGGGDVNSAVKTLPAVQNADEGTGLYVRGGDYTETKTFIDGAPMFTAYQFAAPTGSVAGTINPFLTDGIVFSAGGFGARWGDALSGIVDLQPQGRPQSTSVSVNATLLSVGAGASARLDHGFGASATIGFNDLSTLFAVNGNPRDYEPAPHGNTESAQAVWEFSQSGRVTVFGLRQQTAMGIAVQDPAFASTYRSTRRSDIVVASLHDTLGRWRPVLSLSTSGLTRGDSDVIYRTTSVLRMWQARAETEFAWSPRATMTAGVDLERLGAAYDAITPSAGYDPLPGAATTTRSFNRGAGRNGEYAQLDVWPLAPVNVVIGARSDRSGFATDRTVDPRISTAWHVSGPLTITGSVGRYHQVADPAFLDEARTSALPAIGAVMAIGGAQLGDGDQFARLELWRKRYDDLVALTRNFEAVRGLAGRASGFDLFARSPGPLRTRLRLTWSAAWARRTDPNTLVDAPAPFDVTHSITAVIERDWANGWHVGVAQRLATGRPFTDVAGATFDSTMQVFVPRYGVPNAERLPAYHRADIAVSHASALSGGRFLVIFGAVQNPLNNVNVYSYTWTSDYGTRLPVRSPINRTFFIGANLVQGKPQ